MKTLSFAALALVQFTALGAQQRPAPKPAPRPTPEPRPAPFVFDLRPELEFEFKAKLEAEKFRFDLDHLKDLGRIQAEALRENLDQLRKYELLHWEDFPGQAEKVRAHIEAEVHSGQFEKIALDAGRMAQEALQMHQLDSEVRRLAEYRPQQGTPEDSLYRQAREALNRGEYARAAGLFQSFEQRFPRSRFAPQALYYQAFALYRSGSTDNLRSALEALRNQQQKYPERAADPDAGALRTRIYAALAARGDASAASALRAATTTGASCDEEDMSVRAEALNALTQLDPENAAAAIKRVLARRDECSVSLRRRAVYLLGRSGTEQSVNDLVEVARTDPDPQVRSDAISQLGRSSFGSVNSRLLLQLFNASEEERTRQAVLSALRSRGGPESRAALRAIIERSDLPERVRAQAISQLSGSGWVMLAPAPGGASGQGVSVAVASERPRSEPGLEEEDAAFLRNLYPRTDSRTIKSAIISAVGRAGGSANEQWLMGIIRNSGEDSSLRREAISRLKSLSVDDLGRLYDGLSEREFRTTIVNQLASREEGSAVDKLIDIAKTSTDPQVRRQAVQALSRKKDSPKAMAFIRELVERP